MELSTKQLTWNKDDRCFSTEISDLDIPGGIPMEISVRNPATGSSWTFRHYKTDKDGSGEDTYGWRFRADEDRTVTMLIIND